LGELEKIDEQIEEALRDEESPKRREGYVYSGATRRFFGKIKALRGRGYSFVQICRAYEKIGQLPKHSNPNVFRQAFLREAERRKREGEILKELKDGDGAEKTKTRETSPPVTPEDAEKKNLAKEDTGDEGEDSDRIRKMTGKVVETGLGKIIKYADGSFDY
jgi:hypothetical protein